MASTALKKITARAKQIRKAHKNLSWIQAVKKSSAEYRTGKKITGVRKKSAAKKTLARHKDTKSHNVNIKVVSGTKKKISALPVGFTGSFLGYKFKILNQYQIDGSVTAQIVEANPPGRTIAELSGNSRENDRAVNALFKGAQLAWLPADLNTKDSAELKKRVVKFVAVLNKDVAAYNSGKDKRTVKKKPAKIIYKADTKKASVSDQIISIMKYNKSVLPGGYKIKPGNIRNKISGYALGMFPNWERNAMTKFKNQQERIKVDLLLIEDLKKAILMYGKNPQARKNLKKQLTKSRQTLAADKKHLTALKKAL